MRDIQLNGVFEKMKLYYTDFIVYYIITFVPRYCLRGGCHGPRRDHLCGHRTVLDETVRIDIVWVLFSWPIYFILSSKNADSKALDKLVQGL